VASSRPAASKRSPFKLVEPDQNVEGERPSQEPGVASTFPGSPSPIERTSPVNIELPERTEEEEDERLLNAARQCWSAAQSRKQYNEVHMTNQTWQRARELP